MSLNVEAVFELCKEEEGFDPEKKKLLDRLLTIKSPMNFDFATDEELDALVEEMDREAAKGERSQTLRNVLLSARARRSRRRGFI